MAYKKVSLSEEAYKKINIVKAMKSLTLSEAIEEMFGAWLSVDHKVVEKYLERGTDE